MKWRKRVHSKVRHTGESRPEFLERLGKSEYEHKKFIKRQLINSKGAICAICGKPITDMKDCTIDHIRPLSKGGLTTLENCQLAHRECNFAKGADWTEG